MANGDDPEEIKKRSEATEENTESNKENAESLDQQGESAEKAAEKVSKLQGALDNLKGAFDVEQSREFLGVLRDQVNAFENLEGGALQFQAAALSLGALQRELADAIGTGNDQRKEFIEQQIELQERILESTAASAGEVQGLREAAAAYIDNAKILAEREQTLSRLAEIQRSLSDNTRFTGIAITGMSKAMNMAGYETLNFSDGLGSAISGLTQMGIKLDDNRIAFQQNTGAGQEQVEQMESLVQRNTEFGVVSEEATKALSELRATSVAFLAADQATQASVADTIVQFERLGVASGVSAQAIDLLTKGMGMSLQGARDALPEFDALAGRLGMPTGRLIEDFTKLGPKLARFGKDAKKEFSALAEQARKLGVDVSEAFDLAEAFDTFEGAADMAGKLNAQLGLQINSVEMLGATHEQRIKLLRAEFAQSGMNFEQLGRRQKQAVAEMMGMDVSMAAKFFGSEADFQAAARAQKTAAERAEELTTIQQKQAAALENISIMLAPLINKFAAVAELMAGPVGQGFAIFGGIILGLVGAVKTIVAGMVLFNTILRVNMGIQKDGILTTLQKAAATKLNTAADGAGAGAASLGAKADLEAMVANLQREVSELRLAKAQTTNATATTTAGNAAGGAAMKMLALGAAVALIGAGIYFAATGMGNFVESFNQLDTGQLLAAGLGLVGLGVGLYFLIPALAGFAKVGTIATGILYAMGGAIALIGIGIGAAAAGIGMFIESIGSLSEDVTVSADSMEKLTQVVKVTSQMDKAQLESAESVFDKIISVMVQSNGASVPALNALADAVVPAVTGEERVGNKTVELKVDGRKLGEVIVNILADKYDLKPK
jgi:hypothetical protein